MEKKLKIELPKKYSVGIEVLVPIRTNHAIEMCQFKRKDKGRTGIVP